MKWSTWPFLKSCLPYLDRHPDKTLDENDDCSVGGFFWMNLRERLCSVDHKLLSSLLPVSTKVNNRSVP